jgi:SAM-dependent methyltransferase
MKNLLIILDKMKISDIIDRVESPRPWVEGDNIPWHDPEFSERMLKEHLSQDHDHASRQLTTIDKQVTWIHNELLSRMPTRILDLGCGPGLYTHQLSMLGHRCVGIDYAPASIAYAIEKAQQEMSSCQYVLDDIRTAEYGDDFRLVMFLYGEFNSLSPLDARSIVGNAYNALRSDGILLLEPHTFQGVKERSEPPTSWSSRQAGLFSSIPHVRLVERTWDEIQHTTTIRYYIIDGATCNVTRYAQSAQAYTNEEYSALLTNSGFNDIKFVPSLTGSKKDEHHGLQVIVARK